MPARWAINTSARWVDPPTQLDRSRFGVRGPIQTDRNGSFRTSIDPLYMPLPIGKSHTGSERTPSSAAKVVKDVIWSVPDM
jgi:hypothetical protein